MKQRYEAKIRTSAVGIRRRPLEMRLQSLSSIVQRAHQIGIARAVLNWNVLEHLIKGGLYASAQLVDSRCVTAVFVDQTAFFGIEILSAILNRCKHVCVFHIAKRKRADPALRLYHRNLDRMDRHQLAIIQYQSPAIWCFPAAKFFLAMTDACSGFNQIGTSLGAGQFDHPVLCTAYGADRCSQRGTESLPWPLVATWALRHREYGTGYRLPGTGEQVRTGDRVQGNGESKWSVTGSLSPVNLSPVTCHLSPVACNL